MTSCMNVHREVRDSCTVLLSISLTVHSPHSTYHYVYIVLLFSILWCIPSVDNLSIIGFISARDNSYERGEGLFLKR